MTATALRSGARDAWRFVLSVVRDPHDNTFSPVVVGALVAMWALTKGFLSEVAVRQVEWTTFVGYAASMVLVSGAPLAGQVLAMMGTRGPSKPEGGA